MLSVVFCVRDRDERRLRYCFQSLLDSDKDRSVREIVLVDYGSTLAHTQIYRRLATEFPITLKQTPRDGPFSRSRALNIGIRQTSEDVPFILCSDIDMIYAPEFLSKLTSALSSLKRAIVTSGHLALTQVATEQLQYPFADFKALSSSASVERYRPWPGPCLATSRSWLFRANGFDERFERWGSEDGDLLRRGRRDGLRIHWLHGELMFHQWHPTQWQTAVETGEFRQQHQAFHLTQALFLSDRSIRRNGDNWGNPPKNSR